MTEDSRTEISIQILPLENMTGRKEFDVFCNTFSVDLITEFSRFRQFRVIAPSARSSNAEYVFRGTFHPGKTSNLRLNAQLLNNKDGTVTWADWQDLSDEEITSIQELLTRQVINALQLQVNYDLLIQSRRKSPASLSAYEHWLSGMDQLKKGSVEADERARTHFEQAISIDPNYALAYTGMSLTYFNEWSCQLWERWDASQKGAYEWAKKAIDLDEQNHIASLVLGRIFVYEAEYEIGEHYLRKALRLNPNDADCMMQVATYFVFLGHVEEARSLYKSLPRLGFTKEKFAHIGAFIALEQGEFKECVEIGSAITASWVDFPAMMAAASFELDDLRSMERYWNIFLDEFKTKILKDEPFKDNAQAVQWLMNISPYKSNTKLMRFWNFISGRENTVASRNFLKVAEIDSENLLNRENDLWYITFKGKGFRIKDSKGLRDLATLLSQPGQAVHCTALVRAESQLRGVKVFDETARQSYRKKIAELEHDLMEAEASDDTIQLATLQREYDQLVKHLQTSVGLRGKTRNTNDPVEKIRAAVTLRIRSAIRNIKAAHPELGKHLGLSIKTGTFCSYEPEGNSRWVVES